MATNLSASLHTIGGVGRLWILDYANNWDGKTTIEALGIPSFNGSVITGFFDLVGKLDMDSVDNAGDDINIVDHKFTDGSVGVRLAEDGTYGFTCQSMNIAPIICKTLLNMSEETASTSTTTLGGKGSLAYGKNSTMGYINPCAVFLETLNSDIYSGILFPYASLTAKLQIAGNKTDIWTINIEVGAQNCPLQTLCSTGDTATLTAKLAEAAYVLVPKTKVQSGS
jgi:hypothetical protein